jgi:hypothetical protein
MGEIYKFTVWSLNEHGIGNSTSLSLLCAINPSVPSTPTTINSGSDVIIQWTAPESNGSPITAY